ncbi:MAG: Type 1 glutamine amidotransferase-like domain-containing protein [bacterium]
MSGKKLKKQIRSSELIYILGGENKSLKNVLKKVKDLKELFKGKVIVGSSAGAYVLSTYYYSDEDKGIFSGFGILPIKVIGHYSPRLKKILKT